MIDIGRPYFKSGRKFRLQVSWCRKKHRCTVAGHRTANDNGAAHVNLAAGIARVARPSRFSARKIKLLSPFEKGVMSAYGVTSALALHVIICV
jgi:hypothetical protein